MGIWERAEHYRGENKTGRTGGGGWWPDCQDTRLQDKGSVWRSVPSPEERSG